MRAAPAGRASAWQRIVNDGSARLKPTGPATAGSCIELLLRCDQSLPEKKVGGIGQTQIICHTFEVAVTFFLLHADALEQERSPAHIHRHIGDFPNPGSEFSSLYHELAALFEMSKQPAAKFDF